MQTNLFNHFLITCYCILELIAKIDLNWMISAAVGKFLVQMNSYKIDIPFSIFSMDFASLNSINRDRLKQDLFWCLLHKKKKKKKKNLFRLFDLQEHKCLDHIGHVPGLGLCWHYKFYLWPYPVLSNLCN